MDNFQCNEQHIAANYNYKQQIEKELIDCLPDSITTKTQAGKIVRTAASILRLNLLECALLGWLLKKSNYSLRDLSSSANHISLFEQDQNKELLLLILLNAYYVKSFLSKESSPQIDAEVLSLIPQFSKIYKTWRPDSLLKDASLPELNLTFNAWTLPPKRPKPDYNQLVSKILQLSKIYNVVSNEQDLPKKKRKPNEANQPINPSPKKQLYSQQQKNNLKQSQSMLLRSSLIDHPQNEDIFGYEEPQAQPLGDLLRRSTRLRSGNYMMMNFDLDNSKGYQPGFNNLLGQSLFRSNSNKGLFAEDKATPNNKFRRTSSFDKIKE